MACVSEDKSREVTALGQCSIAAAIGQGTAGIAASSVGSKAKKRIVLTETA